MRPMGGALYRTGYMGVDRIRVRFRGTVIHYALSVIPAELYGICEPLYEYLLLVGRDSDPTRSGAAIPDTLEPLYDLPTDSKPRSR